MKKEKCQQRSAEKEHRIKSENRNSQNHGEAQKAEGIWKAT